MERESENPELINQCAVVTYIPDPLGSFLDELRKQLVPSCLPRAHVTILPPRPLNIPVESAWEIIRTRVEEFPLFEIEATDVEVFETTNVVYLAIGKGFRELVELHDRLSNGPLAFEEPYPYHPHITLAQGINPEQVPAIVEQARVQWQKYPYERSFVVEHITFVQNTTHEIWIDLAETQLGKLHAVGS